MQTREKRKKVIVDIIVILCLVYLATGMVWSIFFHTPGSDRKEFLHVLRKVDEYKHKDDAISALSHLDIEVCSRVYKRTTPLMWFAGKGDVDAVRLLLALGADTSKKDYLERTAADLAKIERHNEVYFLLTDSHISDSRERGHPGIDDDDE